MKLLKTSDFPSFSITKRVNVYLLQTRYFDRIFWYIQRQTITQRLSRRQLWDKFSFKINHLGSKLQQYILDTFCCSIALTTVVESLSRGNYNPSVSNSTRSVFFLFSIRISRRFNSNQKAYNHPINSRWMQPPLQDFAVGYDIDRSVVEIQARTTSFTPNLISSLGWLTTTAETAKTSKHVIKNQHVKTHLSNVCIRKCAKHIYIITWLKTHVFFPENMLHTCE